MKHGIFAETGRILSDVIEIYWVVYPMTPFTVFLRAMTELQ